MGNCGSSTNCEQCYAQSISKICTNEIDVDPDIAGYGILTAFFFSAVITCIAIFWGYVTDSLPLSVLTNIDTSAIARYQRSGLATYFFPRLGRCWYLVKSFVLKIFAPKRDNSSAYTLTRERRQDAIVRLVLALSDQQLVTGIAIMVAAIVNRCNLTLHELRIVECLAWFSATTHLATLPVLREYMRAHPIVRNWRVIGVYVFLILLGFIQVVGALLRWKNAGRIVQCVLSNSPRVNSVLFQTMIVYLYLVWKHTRIILPFYFEPSVKLERNPDLFLYNGWSQYMLSFLSKIVLIVFSLAYGVSKTAHTIWINGPKPSERIRHMGFGQVVAIAFICLPLLTAAEIYNETKGSSQMSSHVQGNHPTPGITNNPRLDDGSERTEPQIASSPIDPRLSLSSNIQQTNSIPSLPILSPDPNLEPPKLACWVICIFVLDLALMIYAGITWPITDIIFIWPAILIWIWRMCAHIVLRGFDYVAIYIRKLRRQRSKRVDAKGKLIASAVAIVGDDDATQASSGQATPGTSISSGRSSSAGRSRSASSVSLHTLSLPSRQDTEASVGLVPAVSPD